MSLSVFALLWGGWTPGVGAAPAAQSVGQTVSFVCLAFNVAAVAVPVIWWTKHLVDWLAPL